jgi:hypothetical protein
MRAKEAAMIELTEEQRQELASPEPVAVDARTGEVYILVRQDIYARLRGFLEEDMPGIPEVALLLKEAIREDDGNDPLLPSYQKYLEQP